MNEDILKDLQVHSEIDLVEACRNVLINAGLMHLVVANFDNNVYVLQAKGLGADAQRFFLNKFWVLQLCTLPINTMHERFCLVPNGEFKDWLRLFEKKIVPVLLEHNLPTSLAL